MPIICICNDRMSQKVRSLANYCYDLRFARPQKGSVAQRMVDIAKRVREWEHTHTHKTHTHRARVLGCLTA